MRFSGNILKMSAVNRDKIEYNLPIGADHLFLNDLLGTRIQLNYLHKINCIKCGRETKTSFAQGYCYPCFMSAPETEDCVLKPELCKAHEGVARDMDFAREHCLIDHIVYLAVSSGLKVGVTRHTQIPTRWIDQGANYAIQLARTPNRYTAGLIEVALKDIFADKTNWRNMLTNNIADVDLEEEKGRAEDVLPFDLREFVTGNNEILTLHYPVLKYPSKVNSINLDKTDVFSGILTGIKGQYLLFEDGNVINIRKHAGYLLSLEF
ncbi:MAG: DUF2797 domain-containing protein [Bacteroidales bacterium]|nr:DUF2797 domain-containing protein [Bacteroidales bacterium]